MGPRGTQRGFVYFVAAPEVRRVKIGFTTKRPRHRVQELQTSAPVVLGPVWVIGGTQNREEDLHHRFRRSRVIGEWFRFSRAIRHFIATACRPIRLEG